MQPQICLWQRRTFNAPPFASVMNIPFLHGVRIVCSARLRTAAHGMIAASFPYVCVHSPRAAPPLEIQTDGVASSASSALLRLCFFSA